MKRVEATAGSVLRGVTGMTPDREAVQHGDIVYPRTDTSRQLVEKTSGNAKLDVQG